MRSALLALALLTAQAEQTAPEGRSGGRAPEAKIPTRAENPKSRTTTYAVLAAIAAAGGISAAVIPGGHKSSTPSGRP